MTYRILGISGSPVKAGNVETTLQKAIESISQKDFSYDIMNLSTLKVQDCIQCNFCVAKQTAGRYCSLKDDGQAIFEKAEAADIIILASPVYFMRTSGRMASLIDRFRVFAYGNVAGGKLRDKIGVSLAVAWRRHGGLETTHLSHLYAFIALQMIPAGAPGSVSPLGISILSSAHGEGAFDPAIRLGIEQDEAGLDSAKIALRRALHLAKRLKKDAETTS